MRRAGGPEVAGSNPASPTNYIRSNQMIIQVKAKTRSRQNKIEKKADGSFIVWTQAPAIDGKANHVIIKILSKYFDVPPTSILLSKGSKSINKQFEIYH